MAKSECVTPMSETEFLKLRHELRRSAALMSREQALDLADHLHLVIRARKAATLPCGIVGYPADGVGSIK